MQQFTPATSSNDRSTCQWIAQHARQHPMAVAVVDQRRRSTYRTLATHIVHAIDALTEAGIKRGQVAGIEAYDRYTHLLIMLACAAMDVTTTSLVPSDLAPPFNLGRLCDRLVVSQPLPGLDPSKTFMMTGGWITSILALPERAPPLDALECPLAPDGLTRLIKSSGTTGVPKVMGMSNRVQQCLIEKYLSLAAPRIMPHPNFLCAYHFSLRGSTGRALATLQMGGTIHLADATTIWELISSETINFAVFLAGDLERFLRTVPSGQGPFNFHLDVGGSAVSPRLRQETRDKLTKNIFVIYGCNEANRITLVDEHSVGTIFPEVSVMIVDEHGTPVPPGERGLIRVKTDTLVGGYIDAPELTRAAFIDGWYQTNDVGFQPAPDKLVLLGRADDLLNIGGLKIAPGPIEERLKTIEGVSDAVVTSIANRLDTNLLVVAVETGQDSCSPELEQQIMPIIRSYASHYHLISVPVFPRTDTGKVRRNVIQQGILVD